MKWNHFINNPLNQPHLVFRWIHHPGFDKFTSNRWIKHWKQMSSGIDIASIYCILFQARRHNNLHIFIHTILMRLRYWWLLLKPDIEKVHWLKVHEHFCCLLKWCDHKNTSTSDYCFAYYVMLLKWKYLIPRRRLWTSLLTKAGVGDTKKDF